MLTFPSGAVSFGIVRVTKKKESTTGTPMVPKPLLRNQKNKKAEEKRWTPCRSVLLNLRCVASFPPGTDTKATNKEEPTPTVRSMDRLFGRDEQKKSRNKTKKRKAPNANLSFWCRVVRYRPSDKKKQQQGHRQFQNLSDKTKKIRKQRRRDGRLVDRYRSTSGVLHR